MTNFKKYNLKVSIAFEKVKMMKKSFAIHVLCEYVANNDTEAELRQNHVMWLQSRDVTKMTRFQDEMNRNRFD
jgi:hypothetical protein